MLAFISNFLARESSGQVLSFGPHALYDLAWPHVACGCGSGTFLAF